MGGGVFVMRSGWEGEAEDSIILRDITVSNMITFNAEEEDLKTVIWCVVHEVSIMYVFPPCGPASDLWLSYCILLVILLNFPIIICVSLFRNIIFEIILSRRVVHRNKASSNRRRWPGVSIGRTDWGWQSELMMVFKAGDIVIDPRRGTYIFVLYRWF